MANRDVSLGKDSTREGTVPTKGNGQELALAKSPDKPAGPKPSRPAFAFSGEGRVGQLAVEAGLITDEQLTTAIHEQEKSGKHLTDLLHELYGITSETTQSLQAQDAGIGAVDLARLRIDPLALKKVTRQFAMENKLIPVSLSKNRLTVAMANPFELATLDELQFKTRLYIDTRYAPESKIVEAIRMYYETADERAPAQQKKEEKLDYTEEKSEEGNVGSQVIRLVDSLMNRAIKEEATDIHIEPEGDSLAVRFRIDGILHVRPFISKALQPAVITRVKIMANMDISESRLPQDGRISFQWEGKN